MSSASALHGTRAVVTVEDRDLGVARRARTLARSRRHTMILWVFVALMVGGLTFLGGTGAGGQSAQAFDLFCMPDNSGNSPSSYGAGVDSVVPHIDPITGNLASTGFGSTDKPYGNRPVTAYEWFGGAGMSFSAYYGDKGRDGQPDPCFPFADVMYNFMANSVFAFTSVIVGLVDGLFQWASAPALINDFLVPITAIIKGRDGNSGLDDQLFLPFFTPLVMLGALWMGYKGLVKSRTTEAIQGAIWMICAGAFALFFMAQPTLIAEWSDKIVSSVTSTATAATTSTAAKATPTNDVCYLPDNAPQAGPRTASCAIWKAMLFTPWSTGQFGVPPSTSLTAPGLTTKVGDRTMNDLRVAQLDAQSFNHDDAVSKGDMGALRTAKNKKWEQILDVADGKPWWGSWAGSDAGQRFSLATAAFLAALVGGALIAIISFTILTLQLFNLLLILTGPLFLLVGVHPGFGRKIGLKWLELIVSTVLKRLVLGFMLAVLVAMYQVILIAPMAWFAQVVMIFAVGVGFFMFRKPMVDAFAQTVNFGGQSIGAGSNPKQKAKRALNAGIGTAAGARGAKKSGAGKFGVIQGAFQGGSRGGRSASVIRAATIGSSAGRTAGFRSVGAKEKRAKDKAAEQAAKDAKNLSESTAPDGDGPNDWDGPGVTGTDRGSDGSGDGGGGRKGNVPRPDTGDERGDTDDAGGSQSSPRPDRPEREEQSERSAANEDSNNQDRADRRDRDEREAQDRRVRDEKAAKDRVEADAKRWREQQETTRTSTLPSDQLRRSREAAAARAAANGNVPAVDQREPDPVI